jgi:hypothetical protein
MPVEIKELVIRAVITQQPEANAAVPSGQGEASDLQTIVNQCVRQVLKILKKSKER